MTVEHGSHDRQTTADMGPPLTAGITLKAVDALNQQDTFTRAQVAYLIHLAYQTGRTHGAAEDMAEMVACWREFAQPRPTREQRVRLRHAEMAAGAERIAQRPKRAQPPIEPGFCTGVDEYGNEVQVGGYVNPDVEWPEVAVPGRVRLRAVA